MENEKLTILAVDDASENLAIISNLLKDSYKVKVAKNGLKAVELVKKSPPDLILLDIMMPEMDGYQVIQILKSDNSTCNIPVIFLTGKTEASDETEGFERGAVDYISKPFNAAVVKARVNTHIQLELQRRKIAQLLENTLPLKVIEELKETGSSAPEQFQNVSVMFSDFVNFTQMSTKICPEMLINELSEIFTVFDNIISDHGCERIKTIGDAYLAVCGMPEKDSEHAQKLVKAAVEMRDYLKQRNSNAELQWENRIGIHSGPVVGGIVGVKKYIYDIFGDTVNTASRIESASEPMAITVSQDTYDLVKNNFSFFDYKSMELKGKGILNLYRLTP